MAVCLVVTTLLNMLLLPVHLMARGMYDFVMSVSYDVFAYNSRISESTVLFDTWETSKQEFWY